MISLRGDLENAGGIIAFNSAVTSGNAESGGVTLVAAGIKLTAKLVINACGLLAPALAQSIEGMPKSMVPRAYFAKGNYFALRGRSPFTHLIYPIPEEGGLGIHATLDLSGAVRFGPDVEWIEAIDYSVDETRAPMFEASIRQYWPLLPADALVPAYAGVRPKVSAPGEPSADFVIQGPNDHGVEGFWNFFGIESPGLTASLALAAELRRRIAS